MRFTPVTRETVVASSVGPTLDLPQGRFHAGAQLALVLVRVEGVQRMRRQDVLDESTAPPHVERWDDRPGRASVRTRTAYRREASASVSTTFSLCASMGYDPPATYLVYDVHGIAQMRDTHTGDD